MRIDHPLNRRDVVKGLGVAGVGAIASANGAFAADEPTGAPLLPTRKLGKNGPKISMLALGGDMQADSATSLINRAWALGYRYFDTAEKYGRGHEESVYKEWFARHPERRREVFLVTKDYPKKGPHELLTMVDDRLKALGTDYIDLYFIHQLCPEVYGADSVNWAKRDEFRDVAEKLKKSGKVKMVGFSCHGGPEYIQTAAEGGYLDALMVFYTPFYERGGIFDRALTACHEKGIGLIAMKTLRHVGEVPKRLPAFEKLGLTTHQALLQAVWSDPRITAVCNSVRNGDQMRSSIAAAHSYKSPLNLLQIEVLKDAVLAGRRTMCPGCPSCDAKARELVFAFKDVARYVTYFEQDADHRARDLYRALPVASRDGAATDLVSLREACAFGIDYPEVVARAERYFG